MSQYTAKIPDKKGFIEWTPEEHETWRLLYERQMRMIQNRACDEFITGVARLNLPSDHVPQLPEINAVLKSATGWAVQSVDALIPVEEFFDLLSRKHFPAATFIRKREELDYLQEPDLFHEYFGHCPLLTCQAYADFMEWYGKLALKVEGNARNLLARLFWFTIEFGLMSTGKGPRIYGGGILSSKGETVYAIESAVPERKPFVLEDVLRTPYRIDIMQPIYYCIKSFDELYHFNDVTLIKAVERAAESGDFVPAFIMC